MCEQTLNIHNIQHKQNSHIAVKYYDMIACLAVHLTKEVFKNITAIEHLQKFLDKTLKNVSSQIAKMTKELSNISITFSCFTAFCLRMFCFSECFWMSGQVVIFNTHLSKKLCIHFTTSNKFTSVKTDHWLYPIPLLPLLYCMW